MQTRCVLCQPRATCRYVAGQDILFSVAVTAATPVLDAMPAALVAATLARRAATHGNHFGAESHWGHQVGAPKSESPRVEHTLRVRASVPVVGPLATLLAPSKFTLRSLPRHLCARRGLRLADKGRHLGPVRRRPRFTQRLATRRRRLRHAQGLQQHGTCGCELTKARAVWELLFV